MTFEALVAHCMEKPGAYEDHPFGPIPVCYKVCGKLFLQLYPKTEQITISCERLRAELYRSMFPAHVRPGYHCPGRLKPHMNTVDLGGDVPDELILEMIDHSYATVVAKLPRRLRETLPKSPQKE